MVLGSEKSTTEKDYVDNGAYVCSDDDVKNNVLCLDGAHQTKHIVNTIYEILS